MPLYIMMELITPVLFLFSVPNNTIKATTKPVYVVVSGKVTKDKFKVS